jgi:SAM-dependent methyltransferase
MSVEITSCPLCEKTDFQTIYLAKDMHYGITGIFKIVRCTGCSLMFVNPMYSDEELGALYPADYYAYQEHFSRRRWKEIVKFLLWFRVGTQDLQFKTPGRMLDLGCGTGWFLRQMRDKGWEVYGVEINSVAAELGRTKDGLSIVAGTLKHANFPTDYFDYVRANHSFEHISCPGETLDEIHRVLRPGGRLMVGVPNVAGLSAKIFRQYWWHLCAPVHPFTYSVGTLSQFLEKHHFEITKVNYTSDYSGILGSAQIWLNRKNGRKSTEGASINNPVLKLLCQWIAQSLDLLEGGDAIQIVAKKCRPTPSA